MFKIVLIWISQSKIPQVKIRKKALATLVHDIGELFGGAVQRVVINHKNWASLWSDIFDIYLAPCILINLGPMFHYHSQEDVLISKITIAVHVSTEQN